MFSSFVQEQLGYYVYRLVDPRDAKTFYIGNRNNWTGHIGVRRSSDMLKVDDQRC